MTLTSIFVTYKWKISFTLVLVWLESLVILLFPLFIGYAIDGLLEGSYVGIQQLAALGVGELIIGSARRFYDTRIYSGIYRDLAFTTVERDKVSSTSTLSARVTMLKELVEFFEVSFPDLIVSTVSVVGTVVILYSLNFNTFLGCVGLLFLIVAVFGLTSKKTISYNYHYNNAMEKQVTVVEKRKMPSVKKYLKELMSWNIRLSDIETLNFGIIWLGMIALIIFSIYDSVTQGVLTYGAIFSVVMYVFEFEDEATELPELYQQWLRLREISKRLRSGELGEEAEAPT